MRRAAPARGARARLRRMLPPMRTCFSARFDPIGSPSEKKRCGAARRRLAELTLAGRCSVTLPHLSLSSAMVCLHGMARANSAGRSPGWRSLAPRAVGAEDALSAYELRLPRLHGAGVLASVGNLTPS